MGSYYYLVSQLPYLVYGQKPPMSPEAFRELARPLLGARDALALDMVSLDPAPNAPAGAAASYVDKAPPCGAVFIDEWREWERALRLNLAKHRAVKVKRENALTAEPPAAPSEAVALSARAVNVSESPLEAELLIDKARWSAIESLQGTDYFAANTVFAYLLKLLILERHASFQAEKGFSEYKSLYASILEGVQSGVSSTGEYK